MAEAEAASDLVGTDSPIDFRKILVEYIDHIELIAHQSYIQYLDTEDFWFHGILSYEEVEALIKCRNEVTLRNN